MKGQHNVFVYVALNMVLVRCNIFKMAEPYTVHTKNVILHNIHITVHITHTSAHT